MQHEIKPRQCRARLRSRRALRLLPLAALLALSPIGCDWAPLAPDSELIPCEAADQRLELTRSSHLDPACVYTGGFDIRSSNVTLDCRGALIQAQSGTGLRGIAIEAPAGADLEHVTVRHCQVEGFLNSLRILREDYRSLERDREYENGTRDILIERNWLHDSVGVGVFVDAYVSDVTIRGNRVEGAGSSGIYLETGSRRNLVEANQLIDNGFRENGPGGQLFRVGSVDFWFWGTGREGISVDGSYENTIRLNTFSGNSAGGIYLYKNCGEFPDSPRYFERRTPSNDNLIAHNVFRGGVNGIWVGSRMGENTLPMECTDPAYVDEPLRRVVRDYAADNVLWGNVFRDVRHAIRVEDDGTEVVGNVFFADSADHHAVIIGTPDRTQVLGEPVRDTALRANFSFIADNDSPFRFVHGEEGTDERWNFANSRPANLCEGEPVPRQPLIFVLDFALAGPGGSEPDVTPDLTVPTVGVLASCE